MKQRTPTVPVHTESDSEKYDDCLFLLSIGENTCIAYYYKSHWTFQANHVFYSCELTVGLKLDFCSIYYTNLDNSFFADDGILNPRAAEDVLPCNSMIFDLAEVLMGEIFTSDSNFDFRGPTFILVVLTAAMSINPSPLADSALADEGIP